MHRHFLLWGVLPTQEWKLLVSPAVADRFFTPAPPGKLWLQSPRSRSRGDEGPALIPVPGLSSLAVFSRSLPPAGLSEQGYSLNCCQ